MSDPASHANRSGRCLHVVWDWNGTLLDDTGACVEALNAILRRQRRSPVTVADYRRTFRFPVREYYRGLGLPCEGEPWNALARLFHEHYARSSRRAPLRAGIRETLDALRARAMPMSVLSACETSILERMIGERGIRDRFEHVCGLDNLDAHSKLETGRDLLGKLALPPAAVLLVGDTLHDREVAAELGCDCLLLANGHQSAERLRTAGCAMADRPEFVLDFIERAH